MKTIEEIRHEWIMRLIEKYGTIANLNTALGRERTHAAMSQLKNKAPNTRTGKVRSMGSELAREIEEKLGMECGTLDHEPPSNSDLNTKWAAFEDAAPEIKLIINTLLNEPEVPPQWLNPITAMALEGIRTRAKQWLDAENATAIEQRTGTKG